MLRLSPRAAASILGFRATSLISQSLPQEETPSNVVPLVTGNVAEVHIDGVFPRTACFVVVDLEASVIRWARTYFVGLSAMQNIQVFDMSGSLNRPSSCLTREGSCLRSYSTHSQGASGRQLRAHSGRDLIRRMSGTPADWSQQSKAFVRITYSGKCGVLLALEMAMPAEKLAAWSEGLNALLDVIPRRLPTATWRWAVSCMKATSERGATGFLDRTELQQLLVCAHASAQINQGTIAETLKLVDECATRELPPWLAGHGRRLGILRVSELLHRLSTSSPRIAELFAKYADEERMDMDAWMTFVSSEQRQDGDNSLAPKVTGGKDGSQSLREEEALLSAKRMFADGTLKKNKIAVMDFAVQLLNPQNDAVSLDLQPEMTGLDLPLTQYWNATSHKSAAHTRTCGCSCCFTRVPCELVPRLPC